MNSRCSMFFSLLICLILGASVLRVSAAIPTPLELNLRTYAGLTISGAVGTVYSIEYVGDLAHANDGSSWRCLEFLQLPASPFLWIDKSTAATERRFYRAKVFTAPANLAFIPSGTFRMGSMSNELGRFDTEGLPTIVTISQGYWMGKCEVTQQEYLDLMGTNPSYFNGYRSAAAVNARDYGTNLSRPVEQVTWREATAYCNALTQREGSAGNIPANAVYRLPTEAEWEYACRAETSTRFSYGEDPGYTNLAEFEWYYVNCDHQTQPVGQKLPNLWGLFDMQGNVWEWCQDWWSDRLPGGMVVDPKGPATGSFRVLRGASWGDWYLNGRSSRAAFRNFNYPENSGSYRLGFRVVLAPGHP